MANASVKDHQSDNSVEDQTRDFYDSTGWVADDQGVVAEDRLFREFGEDHDAYLLKTEVKTAALLEGLGPTVLFAGPGDLPANHVRIADQFDKVVCADISQKSIEICQEKLGPKGEYHVASLMELPLADASVDAALSAHVIYHIDKDLQGKAIRELIRVTRPGGRIVIVYCNPRSPLMIIQLALKALRINKLLGKQKLYTHYFSSAWWQQFAGDNKIEIIPHHPISSNQAKALLPSRFLQRTFYNWAMRFEDANPKLAAKLWTYVTIKIDRVS